MWFCSVTFQNQQSLPQGPRPGQSLLVVNRLFPLTTTPLSGTPLCVRGVAVASRNRPRVLRVSGNRTVIPSPKCLSVHALAVISTGNASGNGELAGLSGTESAIYGRSRRVIENASS